MTVPSPLLLTEAEWSWWYEVGAREARRLVRVQRTLLRAGVDPSPDTALGMSRTVLAGPGAADRLRGLADMWEREAAAGLEVPADAGWAPLDRCPRPAPVGRRCPDGRRS